LHAPQEARRFGIAIIISIRHAGQLDVPRNPLEPVDRAPCALAGSHVVFDASGGRVATAVQKAIPPIELTRCEVNNAIAFLFLGALS
jgi:hypothetical protein